MEKVCIFSGDYRHAQATAACLRADGQLVHGPYQDNTWEWDAERDVAYAERVYVLFTDCDDKRAITRAINAAQETAREEGL